MRASHSALQKYLLRINLQLQSWRFVLFEHLQVFRALLAVIDFVQHVVHKTAVNDCLKALRVEVQQVPQHKEHEVHFADDDQRHQSDQTSNDLQHSVRT